MRTAPRNGINYIPLVVLTEEQKRAVLARADGLVTIGTGGIQILSRRGMSSLDFRRVMGVPTFNEG